MFNIAVDWRLRVSITRSAVLKDDGTIKTPISAIEPDFLFTSQIIGVYAVSPSAPQRWYAAGDLYQALIVPFGNAGAAQGQLERLVLNRYTTINFNQFPAQATYLLSYAPKFYLKDITFQAWEFVGYSGNTPSQDLAQIKADITAIKELIGG